MPAFDVRAYEPWNVGDFCGVRDASVTDALGYLERTDEDAAEPWGPADEATADAWHLRWTFGAPRLDQTEWTVAEDAVAPDEDDDVEEVDARTLLGMMGVGEQLTFRPGDGTWFEVERVR